jgi:truncated hemoglobin YjbI
MRRLRWLAFLCLGAVGVLLAGAGQAQDTGSGTQDRKAFDTTLYNTLRDVINRGADLYNGGDWAGCYRLYEGSLMSLRPLLEHRPELQKAITDGLANAERNPELTRRAFVLRGVIDRIRTDVNPNPRPAPRTEDKVVRPEDKTPELPSKTTPAPPAKDRAAALWDRLGGEKGVSKIVADLVKAVSANPKVDFTRGGRYILTPPDVELLKRHLVQQISSLTGGPFKYEGLDMREVHKDMGITTAQYDAFVADVEKVLKDNGVQAEDAAKIVAAVNSYRKDIIEAARPPKKPEEKTPPEKAPPEKKPEDKAPPAVKTDEKKAEAASLSGKVTSEGKPLTSGTITMLGREKKYSAPIKEDGSYEIKGVKPGVYIVTVTGPAVPKKFTDPKTSSLTLVVTGDERGADLILDK